jgi:hypothetical protein
MEIHDFPPPSWEDNSSSNQSHHAIIATSRSCDEVISAISNLQGAISTSTREGRYHKLVTGVIQTFSGLEVSIQKLATENPNYTRALIAVKQIYQELVQPIVVNTYSNMPSSSESGQIIESLQLAKKKLEKVIGGL